MLNRDWTDKHPDEPCTGCKFFIMRYARCTYKSKKFYCYRDELFAREREQDGKFDFEFETDD